MRPIDLLSRGAPAWWCAVLGLLGPTPPIFLRTTTLSALPQCNPEEAEKEECYPTGKRKDRKGAYRMDGEASAACWYAVLGLLTLPILRCVRTQVTLSHTPTQFSSDMGQFWLA